MLLGFIRTEEEEETAVVFSADACCCCCCFRCKSAARIEDVPPPAGRMISFSLVMFDYSLFLFVVVLVVFLRTNKASR